MSELERKLSEEGLAISISGKPEYEAILQRLFKAGCGFSGASQLVQDTHFYADAVALRVGRFGNLSIITELDRKNHPQICSPEDFYQIDLTHFSNQVEMVQGNNSRRREARGLADRLHHKLNDVQSQVSEDALQALRNLVESIT